MIEENLAYTFPLLRHPGPDASVDVLHETLLLDTISRGVIFVNDDGILTFMNRYAADVLHVWPESVVGKMVDMLPLSTPLYKVLSEQCRGGPMEMVIKGRIIAAQTTTVLTWAGASCGEMTELWDVTEEKRSKRQSEEFVSMMTHDLRSPLTAITGYIQGMQCGMFGKISNRLRTVAQKAEDSAKDLNSMIEEMLDHFRLEVGLLNLNRQKCDMGNLLETCYRDNLRTAQKQGVNLLLMLQENLPDIHVDCRQLMRVFRNLIGNGIKYTQSHGEVILKAECREDAIHVAIVDTGIGIPPEDLSRIFDKYYRSAGAVDYKGTGLGLAISKIIVEAHGGVIEVESTIGAGSTFTVILPFHSTQDPGSAHVEWSSSLNLRKVS